MFKVLLLPTQSDWLASNDLLNLTYYSKSLLF